MKFVILSDIHGNISALTECLKEIEKIEFDALIWCGDYITDFPESHEAIEIIKKYSNKYKSYIVKGNRDQNIIDYTNGKEFNIKELRNVEYTYNQLTKDDISWLKRLPEELEIELNNNKKIYVSHKCTYEDNNCNYKIFGHSHIQEHFKIDNVLYINPGSVGIPANKKIGAQYTILEIKENDYKIDNFTIDYDIEKVITELKTTTIYNDDVKWGRLLEKCLKTGIDYPLKCVEEYDKVRKEQNIKEESLELWNKILGYMI